MLMNGIVFSIDTSGSGSVLFHCGSMCACVSMSACVVICIRHFSLDPGFHLRTADESKQFSFFFPQYNRRTSNGRLKKRTGSISQSVRSYCLDLVTVVPIHCTQNSTGNHSVF